jgi:hypothetical protein
MKKKVKKKTVSIGKKLQLVLSEEDFLTLWQGGVVRVWVEVDVVLPDIYPVKEEDR